MLGVRCRDFIYVIRCTYQHSLCKPFFYTEFGVLLVRALLPVHPIVAAVQSVGVCRRDLEGESSHQLGRIIFPAVMIHGTFDFVLWFLEFLAGDNYNTTWAIMEWVLAELIVMAGIAYYFKESLAQRGRLEQLDRTNSVDQSTLL